MLMPYIVEKDYKFRLSWSVTGTLCNSILKDGILLDFLLTTIPVPLGTNSLLLSNFAGFVSQLSPVLCKSVINAAGSRCASLQPWCCKQGCVCEVLLSKKLP